MAVCGGNVERRTLALSVPPPRVLAASGTIPPGFAGAGCGGPSVLQLVRQDLRRPAWRVHLCLCSSCASSHRTARRLHRVCGREIWHRRARPATHRRPRDRDPTAAAPVPWSAGGRASRCIRPAHAEARQAAVAVLPYCYSRWVVVKQRPAVKEQPICHLGTGNEARCPSSTIAPEIPTEAPRCSFFRHK